VQTHGADIGKFWAKSRFLAHIDQHVCTGCQTCVERCMFDAIEMVKVPGSKKLKAKVDPEKCYGCGVCVLKCKPEALSMETARPLEHIPEAGQASAH
jgi:heterodisulfide reductase subunit A-like polyferredoxin